MRPIMCQVGVGGSGRKSLATLAAFVAEQEGPLWKASGRMGFATLKLWVSTSSTLRSALKRLGQAV